MNTKLVSFIFAVGLGIAFNASAWTGCVWKKNPKVVTCENNAKAAKYACDKQVKDANYPPPLSDVPYWECEKKYKAAMSKCKAIQPQYIEVGQDC